MSTNQLTAKLYHYLSNQRGQGIIEYALLVSLIAVTLIGSLVSLKDVIYNALTSIPFP